MGVYRLIIKGDKIRTNEEIVFPITYYTLRIVDMWPPGFFKIAVNQPDNVLDPSIDNVYISEKGITRIFITNGLLSTAYVIIELSTAKVQVPALMYYDHFVFRATELAPERSKEPGPDGVGPSVRIEGTYEISFSFQDFPRLRYILWQSKGTGTVAFTIKHNNVVIGSETLYYTNINGWVEQATPLQTTRINHVSMKFEVSLGDKMDLASIYVIDAAKKAPPRTIIVRNVDLTNPYASVVWTLLNEKILIYISADGDVTLDVSLLDSGTNEVYKYSVTGSDIRLELLVPSAYVGIAVTAVTATTANICVKVI